ncbi:hypothetical protein CpB0640 [Chlamydia pneumoniae TW-183]|uniref:Uncharacterized protein n=2 Tax=Chlamydia pneumoniae TaxID=83558 RepID=A0A0F7X9H5_CHLPN|nr:hypothetical protein CpB0640 [Chlamydia pneumoniae TW-183]ACZ32499.1 hypothetical protein CPK_ORF00015 [Chlamydia pneumoniae LPCoLN]ETR80524.1 hypothetical protein X556_0147 [Chlamydia pneumoniae B21]CRI33132.1 Uncharacterized protein BN1224_Wien1_A_06390 [Chlamydia pneumoniae]CRI35995.1 Uncharacterized protein BN1224_CM1_A_06420 [Chlamydia pneumoniae]
MLVAQRDFRGTAQNLLLQVSKSIGSSEVNFKRLPSFFLVRFAQVDIFHFDS